MSNYESSAKEIIHRTVVDGINRYVNTVLVPNGIYDEEKYREGGVGVDNKYNKEKHQVAEELAEKWAAALEKRIKQ